MAVLRTDIERALSELGSQENGMRFQGLAVVLGKKRWPELIACQRKKDFGLDAYASSSQTPEKIGKGLAASITPTLKKIYNDAKTAKEEFPDLKMLLFVTPAKIGNAYQKQWKEKIQKNYSLELHIIEREEIITQMMMPENASLCASFLYLDIDAEPRDTDLIYRVRRATETVTRNWASKMNGHPLIPLRAVRLDQNGAESTDVLSIPQIDQALLQSRRIILEGPAGCGKTTTLIQLARNVRPGVIPIIVELPMWASSHNVILEYIAGMPAFQAEGLTVVDLARVQQTVPFLLLLNGWNEITESNSEHASHALRELERDFPNAGIILATRTSHLTPPLPGALRLRLMRLQPVQRANYLTPRLGAKGAELRARIDADPALDELTRTPFILSEVASLFEAGVELPSTKIGVLTQVLHLQEQRDEHRNALQATPIFNRQMDYLKALATEMTRRGAVSLSEADGRAAVAAVVRGLADRGQIEPVGAPAVLATLTAHHIIECRDYPEPAFQFEHQQFQEYYAAIDLRAKLFDLRDGDKDAIGFFTSDYVNNPIWAEPLYMIAETFAEQIIDGESYKRIMRTGGKLVEMALSVDLVFAGELAQLCGGAVWAVVRVIVGDRFRSVYACRDCSFRQYALTAMLATGKADFSDIIVPLLSDQDQQKRLRTYRLWPDIQVSSLGPGWRELVRSWSEEARADFVSEMLHHYVNDEIVAFAVEDHSSAVKNAAAYGLMWTGSDDALTKVLESMNAQTFNEFACKNADRMPPSFIPKAIVAMRKLIDSTTDHPTRLRTALNLIEFDETGLDEVIKDAMAALPSGEMRNLDLHYIQPALKYLRKTDPTWASEWVAIQVAEGTLYPAEYWLPFATSIPNSLADKYLHRLETEVFKSVHYAGMIKVIAARADARLAVRVFNKLRELRSKVEVEPGQRHEFELQVMYQLKTVFRSFPDDAAVEGILLSVTCADVLDIKVATDLISRAAMSHEESLHIIDDHLKERLRVYLKGSIDLVLRQDDFSGEEKADLASSIAQVGKPEDLVDLVTLIHADIERMRRGRTARMTGARGPLCDGSGMSYANWHIAAVMQLDPSGFEQVLIDLLSEPEYLSDAANAMASYFTPKSESSFNRSFRYDLMWAAREGYAPPLGDENRRNRFAAALNTQIKRLQDQCQNGKPASGLQSIAKALAAIDGRGSASVLLDMIVMLGQWDQYTSLAIAENLLLSGIVLPASTIFALVDSCLKRTENRVQDPDKYLLLRSLALCPFVDDAAAGIAKMHDVLLARQRQWGYELRELIVALGESRSDAAVDLILVLASDARINGECGDSFINAVAALDTPRARELLLGFVDPGIRGIAAVRHPHHEDALISRLTEISQRVPEVTARLREICQLELPVFNRDVLSMAMYRLGTPEAFDANLNLIDDGKPSPVPRGIWDQLKDAFVECQPYKQNTDFFTEHGRTSNELRVRLFRMVIEDEKRRKSAIMLLGKIEEWRQEHGRPTGEPRHPDFASGQPWPPKEL